MYMLGVMLPVTEIVVFAILARTPQGPAWVVVFKCLCFCRVGNEIYAFIATYFQLTQTSDPEDLLYAITSSY